MWWYDFPKNNILQVGDFGGLERGRVKRLGITVLDISPPFPFRSINLVVQSKDNYLREHKYSGFLIRLKFDDSPLLLESPWPADH